MPHSTSPRSASLDHTLVAMPTSGQSDRAEALLSLAIALVDSALDVLLQHITSDAQLSRDSTLMPGGTIGKHLRHVIESYRAFLDPLLAATTATGSATSLQSQGDDQTLIINYDDIQPTNRRPIARSVKACRRALQQVRDDLETWGHRARSDPSGAGSGGEGLGVAGEVGVKRDHLAAMMDRRVRVLAITPTRQEMGSTIGRELWYTSLHAIHHFSMLRTIAVHEHGLELPVEFGTAPATLLYRGLGWKPPTEHKEVRVAVKSKL